MSALAQPRFTPDEYLTREREADHKSEYISGEIFAMSGASFPHNLITTNVIRELSAQLKGRPCRALSNDMRVQVRETGMYTYPDVVVVCGEPRFADTHMDTLLNPVVIVEVLSPTTEACDRGEKFAHYRRIASLTDYVLVSQHTARIEHFTRRGEPWLFTEASGPDDAVSLPEIGCRLTVAEVYDKVDFPRPADTTNENGTEPS
jgi:Uma2 family endonuclease